MGKVDISKFKHSAMGHEEEEMVIFCKRKSK